MDISQHAVEVYHLASGKDFYSLNPRTHAMDPAVYEKMIAFLSDSYDQGITISDRDLTFLIKFASKLPSSPVETKTQEPQNPPGRSEGPDCYVCCGTFFKGAMP